MVSKVVFSGPNGPIIVSGFGYVGMERIHARAIPSSRVAHGSAEVNILDI